VDSIIEETLRQWGDLTVDRNAWAGSSSCIFEYIHSPGRLRKKTEQVSRLFSCLPQASEKEVLLTYILQGRDPLIGALNGAVHKIAQLPASERGAAIEKLNAKQFFFAASPVNYIGRVATKNTSLEGSPVSAGDQIIIMLPWANADTTATSSVAFGSGPHTCAGQALALSIATAWIEALKAYFAKIEWERVKLRSFKPAVFVQYGE
jgi:hypothetical protein